MIQTDKIFISAEGAICSAGVGVEQIEATLFEATLVPNCISNRSELASEYAIPLGSIDQPLASTRLSEDNTRSNQLVLAAIEQIRASVEAMINRYGKNRIGTVVGTSTSGIATAENALMNQAKTGGDSVGYDYCVQELSAPTQFLVRELGISGPSWSVSTACTSGGKAFSMAARMLRSNVVDAVVVGGVDSLCRMTIEGFSSLSVVSDSQCLPLSLNRNGINIGEGAAFFVLSREESDYFLSGFGETSDAHHISAPHPEGKGASAAMRQALQSAALSPEEIGYINLHGTATQQNDLIESHVVSNLLGADVACSSTKGVTGHTLAAAGALEALFCLSSLKRSDGAIPVHLFDGVPDPDLGTLNKLGKSANTAIMHAMSNSFAFGGNNISLIFSRYNS